MVIVCRTPPGVRELKLFGLGKEKKQKKRRTPPGVRELKRLLLLARRATPRRTPPGVRELKHVLRYVKIRRVWVAPLPGCVN